MTIFRKIKRKCLYLYRVLRIKYSPFHNFRIKTEFGFHILLDMKKAVDRDFYLGQFENQTLHFFQKIISNGFIIFDVGANIGIYSLLASKKTGAEGHVYSFEPSDWAFQRLNENIRINKCKNISVFKQGISDRKGISDFYVCEDDAYNSIGCSPMQNVKSIKQIDICSIDDICAINDITKIDVIKIDTEGADFLVLQGAKNILHSARPPVLFCEYNKNIKSGYSFSLDDYRNYILSIQYKIFEIKKNLLIEFDPAKSMSSEIICIKENQVGYYMALAKQM